MHFTKVIVFGTPQPEGDDEEVKAFKSMRLRLIVSAIFSIPVFILAMGELIPGLNSFLEKLVSSEANMIVQFVLSVPVVFFAG